MRSEWEIKRLREVAQIFNGGTPDTKVKQYWDGEHLWITPKDMGRLKSIYVDITERTITEAGLTHSSARMLPINSVILSSRAPIGHLAINKKPISFNQGCKGIVPGKNLDTLFLYYFLSNSIELLNELGTGATFKELSASKLAEVQVPMPSLSEQKRIVEILDEAFAAIDKAKANVEKNLQNAKELFESYLSDVFTNNDWGERQLSDVCTLQNGQAHEKQIDQNGKYILVNSRFVSSNGEDFKRTNSALSPLYKGDIVLVMSDVPNGKTLAKCFLIDKNDTYSLNQRICVIRSNIFNKRFLYYQLNRHKHLLAFNNGENQTNLRKNDILNTPLQVPSMDVQNLIVGRLDSIAEESRKLEGIYQKKLDNLEQLKKSILQKAFTGELTTKPELERTMAIT